MGDLIPEWLRGCNEPARLLFVHAHPDDESITTGVTMRRHVNRGDEVTLITCTRGELGEVIPPELQELGVADYRFLGGEGAHDPRIGRRRYKDSGMGTLEKQGSGPKDRAYEEALRPGEEIFSPTCLGAGNQSEHKRLFTEETLHLAYVIREIRPHAVISYAYDGGYGHPDHIRASRVTCEAVGYAAAEFPGYPSGAGGLPGWSVPLQYFIKGCYPGSSDRVSEDPDGELVTIRATSSEYRSKKNAMAAHRTQIILGGEDRYALSNEGWDKIGVTEEYTLVQDPCKNLKPRREGEHLRVLSEREFLTTWT